ncbi:MAG: Rieske 2Fe-2S domain-containing protein [Methylococcaceae bacterium]|nr:Rieske 2Fe-2S domain-containing protein [Methylococcaceae bacterium]
MKIASALLAENDFLTADIELKRRSGLINKANILLFQFNGRVYAYLNHCMHMQRPLNCQQDAIFDRERQRLRCSMHGFVFEPETGVCLSPVCEGQQLQPIKLIEQDGFLSLHDKQAEIVAIYRCGKELI